MPTVYYTDGTSKKYQYYEEIFYDNPYLKRERIPINGLIEYMINTLPFIDMKLIEDKIIKTKTININGLFDFEELKYIYKYLFQMIYPVINEDILKKIINEYRFVKKFYLSNNLIKDDLLDFTLFHDLEEIKLSRNLLTEIPKSIFKLSKLKKLVIIGVSNDFPSNEDKCNISRIPKEIKNLQSLLKLNLENQKLYFLPPEFKELKNLQELYLSDNNFMELPVEIYNLKNLKILAMNRMKMNIPDDIINLKNLEILQLQGTWHNYGSGYDIIDGVNFEKLFENFIVDTKLRELYIDNFTELSYNMWKIKRNLIINSFNGHNKIIEIIYDKINKNINFNKYCEDECEIPIKEKYKLEDDNLYIYNKNMKKFIEIEPY